jgi:predicted RNA-binding protein YlxR (DUF448 family)
VRRVPTHVATRSCVGCNERDAQSRLVRFVRHDGRFAWDPGRRLPGRGAYLHLEAACLEAFLSRKPFLRSLRTSVSASERAHLVAERPLR